RQRRLSPVWMGLAAAGLVAVTATITRQMTKSTIAVQTPSPTVAQTTTTAPSAVTAPPLHGTTVPPDSTVPPGVALASNKPSAEQTYDAEIKRLRLIVAARRSTLDSTTITVIERNLTVIDDAIAQCREALKRDPASRFLIESLNDALDT